MKGFKWLLGVTAVALAAMTVNAATIDSCEGGTNQNQFGAYWYFYDDSADGGNSKIPGYSRDAKGQITGVAPIAAEGNAGSAGYKMSYTMGTVLAPCKDATGAPIAGCGFNYVGVGTMLATEGLTCDIKTAATVTFWAKATPAVILNVEVATLDITDFGYYRTLIPVGTSWAKYTINLDPDLGIMQPAWAKTVAFDTKKVQKIQWQVHSDQLKGKGITAGSVNIDDVTIEPYDFVPPEVCAGCVTPTTTLNKVLLSDFEGTDPNVNAAGQYWYCYNDGDRMPAPTKVSDYSDINAGAVIDPALAIGKSPTIAIDGHGKTGSGAYIGFLLGPNFTQTGSADVIKPFVGVGTKLSTDFDVFYNATADGATGVMFDYKITGASYLRFEVVSSNDLSSSGIVWSRLFPAAADWQTAVVPFDSLKLPNWDKINQMEPATIALKLGELKKIQWAVQDAMGKTGTIAIDNVYLIGPSITKITKLSAGVLYHKGSMAAAGLGASLVNHSLVVTLPSSLGQQNGNISLVNIKGVRVAGKTINVMGGSVADLDVSKVANGLYFAVIKTKNTSGKEFSATIPVNIY